MTTVIWYYKCQAQYSRGGQRQPASDKLALWRTALMSQYMTFDQVTGGFHFQRKVTTGCALTVEAQS